jgi:hypothetical protein
MIWGVHVVLRGRAEVHRGFRWGNLGERDPLEVPGVDEKIILRCIFRNCDEGMDWLDQAQDRDMWRVIVNAVMKLRVP